MGRRDHEALYLFSGAQVVADTAAKTPPEHHGPGELAKSVEPRRFCWERIADRRDPQRSEEERGQRSGRACGSFARERPDEASPPRQ